MNDLKVLCPQCFKVMLEAKNKEEAKCPHCGGEFKIVNENTVKFKDNE